MSTSKRKKESKRVKLKQTKIRIPEETDAKIRKLAKECGFSIAYVVRHILEQEIDDCFATIKCIDCEQGNRIETLLTEISTELRLILNNIKRIGINYNQEIKLKNAENKYNSIQNRYEKQMASIELTNLKKELEDSKSDTNELKTELDKFEELVIRMEDTLCHIQE